VEYARRGEVDLLRRLPGHVRRSADNAKGLHPTGAAPTEAELALVARSLEQVLGEAAGSLVLVDPHRRTVPAGEEEKLAQGRPPLRSRPAKPRSRRKG
jgi:hypothetical protein